jgi:hypothetical protein
MDDKDEEQKPQMNRWGAPIEPDGLVHLNDLDFDYEDYFERHGTDRMTPAEAEEFQARIYGMFCRDVFRSGGDMSKVSFWAANYVAERLHEALGGVPWHDIMRLPWDEPTPMFTPKGQRAFDIYAGVKNGGADNPGANVTDLIAQQASAHNVSFETARSDYYTMKRALEWKQGIPKKFLNRDDDF